MRLSLRLGMLTCRIRIEPPMPRPVPVAVLTALLFLLAPAPEARERQTGILLLAHGGAAAWNERVTAVARDVDRDQATEVAFGMASRPSIQGALDRLAARGVTDVVAVPLFVSSHSSVITSTEFLLGLRAVPPPDLAIFAKMAHAHHGGSAGGGPHADHGAPGAADGADPALPVVTRLRVRMAPAFDRHPIVAAILADRARAVSTAPAEEAVVLVAHGPVPDDDNRRWLDDMQVLAAGVRATVPFAAVDYLTVRDDAGPVIREQATQALREVVVRHTVAGRRVLVVPLLMSYGGIEAGIRKRLEGLAYTMPGQGLMPDDRIAQWVRESVRARGER